MEEEEEAHQRIDQGDIDGVLCLLNSGSRLDFVCDNAPIPLISHPNLMSVP